MSDKLEKNVRRVQIATTAVMIAVVTGLGSLVLVDLMTRPRVVVVQDHAQLDGGSWIQSTFHTGNLVVDNTENIGGKFTSTDLGTDTGNVCGQRASSDWVGPACWNYNAVAGDAVHDVIDVEWNTSGGNVSNSGEQIPIVVHVQGNVDTTLAPSQAIGFQSSVHPTRSAGGNTVSTAAFQGGATPACLGCAAYSFKGDGGTLYNADALFIGDVLNEGSEIDGDLLAAGNTITLSNTGGGSAVNSLAQLFAPKGVFVDVAGTGTHVQVGSIGVATNPTGADQASFEAFAGNGGQVAIFLNNTLAGQKGWSLYNETNGGSSDLRLYNYNLGHDSVTFSGPDDLVTFTGGIHVGPPGVRVDTFSGAAGTASLKSFAGDPNGTVTGGIGSILMDTSTPAIWQNTNGATAWTQFHNAFTTDSSVYYGDGSDGTCNFDGVTTPVCGATLSGSTYTMARDIMAMNSTVSSGVSVFESNYRFMVFNTLTGGGGGANINDSGDNAAGRLGGNCGGIASHFYAACVNGAASGANGTGAGGASSANSLAISQWSTQGTTAAGANGGGNGQGGGGGTAGANAGGGGGAITPQSASVGAFTGVGAWSGLPDKYGVGSPWGLYGTGGGGGGCTGGACTGGGGGGGGGMTFVGVNQCAGTIVIKSTGGNGGAGVLGGGTSAGGGGGAGGGVVAFMYSHRAATCTTSVAAGTGGAGAGTGAAGGNGSSGTAQTYNLSGDGS